MKPLIQNMFKKILVISFVILSNSFLSAQTITIDGKLVEKDKNLPLVGVHLKLINEVDTTERAFTSSDTNGYFQFANIRGRSF